MQPTICTFTNRIVNPLHMKPDDIDIRDIAHGLACCNRFAGQARYPISVAQHSVYVAHLVPPEHRLAALLHDGSEAYLGDITKWVKMSPMMAFFREVENELQDLIYAKFGCKKSPVIDWADKVMVQYEGEQSFTSDVWARQLRPGYRKVDSSELAAIGPWEPWNWVRAETLFLLAFQHLTGQQILGQAPTVVPTPALGTPEGSGQA